MENHCSKFTAEKLPLSVKQFIMIFTEHISIVAWQLPFAISWMPRFTVTIYIVLIYKKTQQTQNQPNIRQRRKGLETNAALDIFKFCVYALLWKDIWDNNYEYKTIYEVGFFLILKENKSINNDTISFTRTVKMCHFKITPTPPIHYGKYLAKSKLNGLNWKISTSNESISLR